MSLLESLLRHRVLLIHGETEYHVFTQRLQKAALFGSRIIRNPERSQQ
jgi:hypothetical protein